MKGYFTCAIADRHDVKTVRALIEFIEGLGHKILDRHVMGKNKTERSVIFCQETGLALNDYSPTNVRLQDLKWVLESEFMVCEVTNGSWGGGIELDHATVVRQLLSLEPIPILCLLRGDKRDSWLISGMAWQEGQPAISFEWYRADMMKVALVRYGDLELAKYTIREFLKEAAARPRV